jgi:hypothetical protein
MGMRKDFFEIYRQFGHAPSDRFSNPGLAVTLFASKFNVQKSYIVFTVYLCDLCGTRNKQQHLPCSALTDWFWITEVESVHCAVRTESYKTVTFRLERDSILKCAQMRTALFWAITQWIVAIPCRRFGKTYRSHLQGCGNLKSREVYARVEGKEMAHYNRYLTLCNWMCNKIDIFGVRSILDN